MIDKHWIQYLTELKKRLLWCLLVFFTLFLACFSIHKILFNFIALPLLHNLPGNSSIIATTITAPFIVPMQISFLCALVFGMPYYLYQLWAFITPALYDNERKNIFPVFFFSFGLFLTGFLFAYFIFLPLAFKFLVSMAPASVQIMPDMSAYLDFVSRFLFAFGLSFQTPIVILMLINSGITSIETLSKKRPYIIIMAFVIGMLLTPPDVISQIVLALPLWGLFELALLLARYSQYKKNRAADNVN
jgi:sec-independent protein translocase protein TatC